MKKCAEIGKIPVSMSIDTWAVDYVLLDESDEVPGDTYGYRDGRTRGIEEEVYRLIPEAELYARAPASRGRASTRSTSLWRTGFSGRSFCQKQGHF